MKSLKFHKSLNEQDQIAGIEIGGMLVLENSQQLKKELVDVVPCVSDQLEITISNPEEIDISCIQLIVGFIKSMNEINVTFQFTWNINEDQKLLLENAGLSSELYLNN